MLGRDDYSGCCSPQGFPLLIVQLPSTKIGSELDALTATSGKNKSGELFFLNCDNPSDSTIMPMPEVHDNNGSSSRVGL